MVGELKVMVPEILFLVALREHNNRLWTRSFPFHFGLYLVGGGTALLIFAGLIVGYAPESIAAPMARLMGWVMPVLGGLGLAACQPAIVRAPDHVPCQDPAGACAAEATCTDIAACRHDSKANPRNCSRIRRCSCFDFCACSGIE